MKTATIVLTQTIDNKVNTIHLVLETVNPDTIKHTAHILYCQSKNVYAVIAILDEEVIYNSLKQ